MTRRRLLITDYAGHPFTYELADALDRRKAGSVAYSYCAATVSPKARFSGDLEPLAVGAGWRFEKYRPVARLISELRYGLGLARTVWRTRPAAHVVCNMPLISGTVVWVASLPLRVPLIVWLQDVQSGLASSSVGNGMATRILSTVETFLLRRARCVIAISPELGAEAERRGVPAERVAILENWAPIEQLPALDQADEWPRSVGVEGRPLFLYAGTLGRKHDPSLLVDLARALEDSGGQVVVISEGEGAETLQVAAAANGGPRNLTVLPYQPFGEFPEALASADVLVAVLEPSAGKYSVPSKTLSYLCAGRPILASIPLDNAAAHLVGERAAAGFVVSPGDRQRFVERALALAADADLRASLGSSGRRYAEAHFAEDAIVEAFLNHVDRVVAG